ncbi:Myb/SANT-like domain-containing protein [Dioscorea alata]|uniref:Myb/SANT-like domain-containing protein n=1 Tax=Dioscorea alata TaxID=55571 RepID=A0ACB7VRI1_DIOAL|nr:Myb/SANT-like domain-containing protein [Dioscorea alata]
MEGRNESECSHASSVKKSTSSPSGTKRWTPAESRYFIRFMANQVEQGLKVDKGFKPQAIQGAIRAMKDMFGVLVTEGNVGNHLRTIWKRWARIKKLKDMSGVGWDNNLKIIIMGEAEYRDYIQVHVQDEPYLNKPIEDYDLLELICGNDQAGGHYAIQNDRTQIGTNMDFDTTPGPRSPDENFVDLSTGDADAHDASPFGNTQAGASEHTSATSPQRKKGKSKRKANTDDELIRELAITINKAFKSVRSNQSLTFTKELSEECMKLKEFGYSTRQIRRVYEHLMMDDARARMFFGMGEEMRKDWLEEFFESFG